jgi:hypothetical protein
MPARILQETLRGIETTKNREWRLPYEILCYGRLAGSPSGDENMKLKRRVVFVLGIAVLLATSA